MTRIAGFPKVTNRTYEDWLWVLNGWHHLVIVFNEAMLPAVYFDGEVPLLLSDGAVYDRALTPDEVAEHFALAAAKRGSATKKYPPPPDPRLRDR